jgi:hypothetical protein
MTLAFSLHHSLPAMPAVRLTEGPHNANLARGDLQWPQLQNSASM